MPESKPTVATPSAAYEAMEKERALPRLLMEGTRALRETANAEKYLPPEEDEETKDTGARTHSRGMSEWDQRVSRSVVWPFFARAVRRAVSAILAEPVALEEDVPVEIRGADADSKDGWWENVDLEGNDGNVFFGRVAEDALGDAGMSFVLVEHQRVPGASTLADLRSQNLRPYLVHVKAHQVIGWKAETVNGRKRTRLLRFCEHYEVEGEWETTLATQIRVLRAPALDPAGRPIADETTPRGFVAWEVWRKKKLDDEQSWEVYDSGSMDPHVEIPVVVYYTGYRAWMCARSPFDDLAHLNILHTQKTSDIGENFRVSLGAQMHRAGATKEELKGQRSLGAKRLLYSESENAKAEWLERTGTAAEIAMKDQDRLEARMLALSHEPHVRRTGPETATGRAIDAAEAQTETQRWAIAMRDCIESTFMLLARYRGQDSGGSVRVVIPPRRAEGDLESLEWLLDMHVKTGAPKIQTILEEAKRQGRLPDDLDTEAEADAVEQSMKSGPEGKARAMMRPLMERMGMSEEEIDAMLDGGTMPMPSGSNGGVS